MLPPAVTFTILTTTPKKFVPTDLNVYVVELLIIFVCVEVTTVNKVDSTFALDRANISPLYKAILLYVP